MSHGHGTPIRLPFFSTGTYFLLGIAAVGFSYGLTRFFTGLGTVTNLNNQFPWGIWIAIDVACGVALAAGGFTTAALIDIFGSRRYRPLLRPAILTAWIGYAMVGFALLFDLGRYWNIWQPIFNWQGNSVLFEVGICVMTYLTVLTLEMAPALLEGLDYRITRNEFGARVLAPLRKPLRFAYGVVRLVLPFMIIAGVVLSCMHQSSLGTLMVITPTKLSPFWYTPWLPVLFLLSAIMVGFPMVILESILANWSFRRKPEMDLLGLLARKIPWFIALYAVFKVGTLIWQWDRLDVFEHPGCTVALAVEMTLGILMPGIMLLIPMVRRSPGWLGFASLLLVLGVVINRVNVFLVGFHPPFVTKAYFPTFGEIALTAAMVATIMLAYRFFALNFPILLGSTGRKGRFHLPETEVVPPFWSGFFRIASVVFLLGFIGLYAVIHGKSIQESEEARKNVYFLFGGASSRSDVEPVRHTGRPGDYQTAFLIKTPLLTLSDDFFGPVRFSHRSHDNFTGGNCALCHHRIGMGEDDREGMDIEEMHAMMDLRLGPPCATCHGDLEDIDLGRCGDCHGLPNEADFPSRLGLKGAYHRQCMGCHEEQPRRLNAPMDCKGCHRPIVPDHHLLVEDLPEDPSPKDISGRCLECHMDAAGEVLESVHWLWGGHSPHIVGYEHHVDLGLETVVNNYLLCAGAHSTYCSSCHISFGRGLPDFDSDDPAAIDCFSCHDTTGTYRKAKLGDESSGKTADLVEVSQNVGAPTRATCGQCHFYSDGGANLKHGDLEPILEDPPNEFDVHMGRNDMSCQECHKARGHKIAGRSMTAPAVEGIVRCVDCHGEMPHGISGILSSHLDDHVRSLACETCHIPTVARETPTRVFLDYSQAGQDREPVFDADGKPTYDKELGEMKWARNLVPVYAWFDGSRDAYVVGEEIDPSETTTLNAPTGDRRNPASKIFPFKIHTAIQPYDTERDVLLVPKLCGSYWKTFDWDAAIREGMEAVGQEYSGSYGFTETKMYTGIHHQVVPKEQSLGCADCHEENAVDCGRCHRKAKGQPIPQLGGRTYAEEERRLDFEALGYEDDPARVGGRFYTVYGKGTPSG